MDIKLISGSVVAIIKNINKKYLDEIPDVYKDNQQKRDNNGYHVTIIHSSEINNLTHDSEKINVNLFIFGLGKIQKDINEVFFLIVHCNYFNKIRKLFSLKEKKYHITVGFKFTDIHDCDKGFDTLIYKNKDIDLTFAYKINNVSILKYLENEYNYVDDKLKILELKTDKNNINHIDDLINNNNYIGYIFKYEITHDITNLEKAVEIYDYDVNIKYDKNNIGTNNMISVLNKEIMKNNLSHRKKLYLFYSPDKKIILHEMPRNFSWVLPNVVGGISKLQCDKDILVLESLGITKIYYFLEKRYFDHIKSSKIEIKYIHCINIKPPTFEDMIEVLETETFETPVLFGCLGGFGRTGTALACYLCYHGVDGNKLSSEKSIHYLRNIRPKSIESNDQINFVKQFSNNMHKPEYTLKKIKTQIKFIMLVGLPGAGKTTFCDLFMTCGLNVKIVNQDVMGRKMCEQSLLKFIKDSDLVILDRTNFTLEDRKQWLSLTQLESKNCLCVYLNTPKFICSNRVKNRENHPTIKKGGGERIINDICNKFEEPTKKEGFCDVIFLEDQEDVREYLKTWHCTQISIEDPSDIHIYKFPRTAHLFNIGGATVDDRFVSEEQYEYFLNNNIQITEKVDGAQMGISIDENYKIMVQNRSHYVNSKSASQFKYLDKWIDDNKDDLYNILDTDHILYGEWLYAKHSIKYNNLPDYFMAFDLFNKREKVFYNREILEKKLENTNIKLVRVMNEGTFDKQHLLKLIEMKSNYTDSRVEGIYLKAFDGDYVKYRSKLVRNDFISGNQHWSKNIVEPNNLMIKNKYQ
jgi:atypical dual specificity phosphatase